VSSSQSEEFPKVEIPEEIKKKFENISKNGENIKIAVTSDMNLDGDFEENWFLATEKRLLVVTGNHYKSPEIIHNLSIADIKEVKLKNYVGNGFLHVETKDETIELLRFTKTAFHKNNIAELPKAIDQLRIQDGQAVEKKKGSGDGHFHEGSSENRCPKCGRIMRRGTCRHCLQKRALLFRLFSYLLPYWYIAIIAFALSLSTTGLGLLPAIITRYLTDVVLAPVEESLEFRMNLRFQEDLDSGNISSELLRKFEDNDITIPPNVVFSIQEPNKTWRITDSNAEKSYIIRKKGDELKVFEKLPPRTNQNRFYWLNIFALALIGVYIFNTVLGTGRTYMMRWLGNKVILDLRTSAYEYLQRLSLSFYNKKETGRLMSRISNDTERLQDFIVNGIQEFVMDIFMIVGMCIVLFIANWKLAALTLIPMPTLIVGSIIFGKKMHMVYHKVWRRMAGISAILADTIPGVRVVKAFAAEDREIDRFNSKNQEYFSVSMRAAKLSTIYFPIMGLATFAGGIIIRWFGGRDIINAEMTLGELMLFMGYMWRFYQPIRGLTRLNHMLQRAASAAERVFEIIDAEPEVDDKDDAIELPTIKGDIEFDNVVFSYDGENNALDGVSFNVEAGEMIGLSGPSGAGKTTLINLIGRFYDVTEGSIKVDGYDVRDVKMQSLRNQIGVVLQEPFLFYGSIADNIKYSKPGASKMEIVAAAKAANAHDFIMKFPDGYDTMLGERGGGLSGGEKQRISIARAILKDPRILILDEATSSVDTETESLIQAAIERLIEGRTTFAIAHRLSTLRKADKLIILDSGEVSEMGTHGELIENDGLYKRLVELQSQLSRIKAV